MKKYLSVPLAAAVFALSMPVQASSVSSFLEKRNSADYDSIMQKAYKSDSGRSSVYNEIQKYVTPISSPQEVSNANELLINITSMLFPQFAGYWDNVATWNNIPVYQNHDLYDLDRMSLPKDIHFVGTPVQVPGEKNLTFENGRMLSTSPYGTTEYLMNAGYPGIGPDGKPIVLCRLIRSKYAPYIELSFSDAKSLFPVLNGSRVQDACLPQELTQDYWKGRVKDFNNRFGDIIEPQRTLEHY
ncbi:hypothetical protein ACI2KR_07465 [Pseudomonas luteola]